MNRQTVNLSTLYGGIILMALLFTAYCGDGGVPADAPYKNSSLPVEERVEDLLARMTLEEKIDQLSGEGFVTRENNRLGIPPLVMADGPVGVRWGNATAFPAAVGIAATWNPDLTQKIGAVIGKELKSKGRNYLLGPCVNIHRFPLGGRNFESYGEDPYLAGQMAVAFIKGVQSQNVLACVKHYALNNQEWERHEVDVGVDERGLREIYLPAYKAAVKEGGVWTVMAAYNKFRGDNCSESAYLLDHILKKEWGFTGFVVSDWRSTYSTAKAANAGLDLEMPWGEFFGDKLLAAVKRGEVTEGVIDDKVRRLMRVRFSAGLFDNPPQKDPFVIRSEEHKQLALEAAKESIVLLNNKNNLLPLDKTKLKSIAIIGPNAVEARTGGGGSSMVSPLYGVSPLQGLKNALGENIAIHYAPGIAIRGDILPLEPEFLLPANGEEGQKGLKAEYFANVDVKGQPVMTRIDPWVNFNWGYDAPHPDLHRPDDRNLFSIRWTGKLLPPKTGRYKLNVYHNDGVRVYLDGKPVIDNWKKNRVVFRTVSVSLTEGKQYDLRIEYFFDGGISIIKFGWELPNHDYIKEAVEIAKKSDVAVVFAGLHARFESEAQDRNRLELPNQDVLIKAVAKANPNTVVVMETGTPVNTEPWIRDIAALVQAWYPGQEGGNAIADVLLGDHNPGGKLPFSYISNNDDTPAFKDYKDKSLKSPYPEGLFVGYRYLDKHNLRPMFPFGHGLSYTGFQYSSLEVEPASGDETAFTVRLEVKNTGKRKGADVVQVYVKDMESSLERPEKELKGFQKVFLEPGQSKTVSVTLKRDAFVFYHPGKKQWTVEPGMFEVRVGSSSTDIRLKETMEIRTP